MEEKVDPITARARKIAQKRMNPNEECAYLWEFAGEVWGHVKGYEGYYMVSTFGRVMSLKRKVRNSSYSYRIVKSSIRKQHINGRGYLSLFLIKAPIKKSFVTHRLVAQSFLPNPENKPQVNHIDGNKLNNDLINLEWCTSSENRLHAFREGIQTPVRGDDRSDSKLTNKKVIEILKCLKEGVTGRSLANKYGVSTTIISLVKSNKTWKHIPRDGM